METLFNYFWLVAIFTNIINVIICWVRVQPEIQKDHSLQSGYIKLLRGYLIGMSIPWLVMGYGLLTQQALSLAEFMFPRFSNPSVLAWWISLWSIILWYTYWLFCQDGAEQLTKHPGFLRGQYHNPRTIKLVWSLSLVGATIAHIILFKTSS